MVLPWRTVNDRPPEGDTCMAHPPSSPHTQ